MIIVEMERTMGGETTSVPIAGPFKTKPLAQAMLPAVVAAARAQDPSVKGARFRVVTAQELDSTQIRLDPDRLLNQLRKFMA